MVVGWNGDDNPIRLVCLGMGTLLSGGSPVGGTASEPDTDLPAVLGALDDGRIAPAAGATEALAGLRAAGAAVCVLTGLPAEAQAALLERFGWRELVDLALPAGGGLRGGPHPDMVLTAVLRLGVDDVRHVAVAADTAEELTGGYRAGASVVAGVLAGGRTPADLGAAPHTHIVKSVGNVVRILLPGGAGRAGAETEVGAGAETEIGAGAETEIGAGAETDTVVRAAAVVAAAAAAVDGSAILDVAGLSIYYGAARAVDSLSLQVMRGEIFGLLGPNGAGKTSTLSAIEGLLRPRSGRITLDGIDVARHPIDARVRMGVQLQATSFQNNLTLRQIVRLYAGLYGLALSDAEVTGVLAGVGLEADIGKEFRQLSGGQKQRLSLQIAVIHQPALLLLDEPTSGLDPQARRQLWARIEHLRRGGGSILLTTHSMEEAQAVCDRVAIIDNGALLTCGSPRQLIAWHQHDPKVLAVAHGEVTLDDVFVGLTGTAVRD